MNPCMESAENYGDSVALYQQLYSELELSEMVGPVFVIVDNESPLIAALLEALWNLPELHPLRSRPSEEEIQQWSQALSQEDTRDSRAVEPEVDSTEIVVRGRRRQASPTFQAEALNSVNIIVSDESVVESVFRDFRQQVIANTLDSISFHIAEEWDLTNGLMTTDPTYIFSEVNGSVIGSTLSSGEAQSVYSESILQAIDDATEFRLNAGNSLPTWNSLIDALEETFEPNAVDFFTRLVRFPKTLHCDHGVLDFGTILILVGARYNAFYRDVVELAKDIDCQSEPTLRTRRDALREAAIVRVEGIPQDSPGRPPQELSFVNTDFVQMEPEEVSREIYYTTLHALEE